MFLVFLYKKKKENVFFLTKQIKFLSFMVKT